MQKILYVITKSNWGGAQRYVFDLANSLPSDEYTVGVACGGNGPLVSKLKEQGIAVFPITNFERDINIFKEVYAAFELFRIIRREKPDIVHLNSSKAGGTGALVARLCGVRRIVFTAHGWPFLEPRSLPWRALAWFFSYLTVLLAHTTIVVSKYDLTHHHMPFVKEKITHIYNGIAPLTFGSGDIIRNAFPKNAYITGTIGELTHNKNHKTLVDEAYVHSDMFVAIVGDGELRSELESQIRSHNLEERVKLFGYLPATNVLKGFDMFSLPSLKEGLPYVLLEAKAAQLPITANHVGGIPEIMQARDTSQFTLETMLKKTAGVYRR